MDSTVITQDVQSAFSIVLDKVNGWFVAAIDMLPNFAVAVVVVILFALLAKLARWGIHKAFAKSTSNISVVRLFGTITYIAVITAGLFIALGVLNLEKTVTSLLAGAGILGLAIGFAFQDIAANFLSGILMAFRKPLRTNDLVETNGFMGTVQHISIRTTILSTFQGQEVMIPNKDVFNNPIVNYTKSGNRRVDLAVGVSYGDDLQKVEDLVKKTVSGLDGVKQDKGVDLIYTEFGDSSINFTTVFWLKDIGHGSYLKCRSEAIKAIKAAFDENDITIPFPIRTLDFGIKGGETFTTALSNAQGGTPKSAT